MSGPRRKFYVVWSGLAPGIYDSWEECELQVKGVKDAKFKAYPTLEAATEAYRGDPAQEMGLFRAMAAYRPVVTNYAAIPGIRLDAIAVDAACSRNPGPVEYQGVRVATGERIFHFGPVDDGSNNIGEYLALVHAAALLDKQADHTTPIYSDSKTAISWVKNRGHRSKIAPTQRNARLMDMLSRADMWLKAHGGVANPILKWNTEEWGEIPADFGRK